MSALLVLKREPSHVWRALHTGICSSSLETFAQVVWQQNKVLLKKIAAKKILFSSASLIYFILLCCRSSVLAKTHWEKHITLCFMTLISTHNHLLWLSPTESVLLLLWKCLECQIYINFLLKIVPNKWQTDHCICRKLLQVQLEKVGLMLNATNMHGKVLNGHDIMTSPVLSFKQRSQRCSQYLRWCHWSWRTAGFQNCPVRSHICSSSTRMLSGMPENGKKENKNTC